MRLPNQRRSLGVLFVLIPLAMAFAIAFYNSANSSVKPYQIFRDKFRNQTLIDETKPPAPSDHVILQKGEKKYIHKTGLVYNGLSDGVVHIDLYLLEFDPDMPYPQKFSKKAARSGIWLDNVQYRLVKVKESTLRLKILGIQESN